MSLFIPMCLFSLSMSISPGPVNMIIVSSGTNYGIRRTVPFVSGATIGFTILLLFVGLGFYQVVNTYPFFLKYLSVAGSAFIIYMGYMIATSTSAAKVKKQKIPSFLQGFLLQWLNPKAWIACVAGASMFSTPESNAQFLTFSTIYFFICYFSLLFWAVLGEKAVILLDNQLRLKVFNLIMGALLIVIACYLLFIQLL